MIVAPPDDCAPETEDQGILTSLEAALLSALSALEFLTVFRFRRPAVVSAAALARSQLWYPMVGLLVGLAIAGVDRLLAGRMPGGPEAVLLLILLEGVSGLLHIDGLADSGDGLLGLHTPERRLEIMRDSATGAFGVAVMIFYLLLMFACLDALTAPTRTAILIVVPVAGRAAMVCVAAAVPYARSSGLASGFHAAARSWVGAAALTIAAGVTFLVGGLGGLALLGIGLIAALLVALFARARIGGMTGDVIGASCEVAQAGVLLFAVVLQSQAWFRPWL